MPVEIGQFSFGGGGGKALGWLGLLNTAKQNKIKNKIWLLSLILISLKFR
jgi:hypothetical protein